MNGNTYIIPKPGFLESIEENRRVSEELRMKEERHVDNSFYTTNIVGLFSFYILKPQSLTSRFDLELLMRYQILPSLNPTFYYINCFIYTLE